MISHGKTKWILAFTLMNALALSGCAGTIKNMQPFEGDPATLVPESDKAMIVFLRPSTLGFAVQSSVFNATEDTPDLVGIVAAKAKVAYQLDPGDYLFMVIGESADFMTASVAAGKTYYVLVTPRMGAWKARFSLRPVALPDQNREEMDEWLENCSWVEKNAASDTWAASNIADIQDKQARYYTKWMEKNESDRPRLTSEDGIL